MEILVIVTAFLVKHFICDFPLQTRYMLGKFGPFPGYVLPLALHCKVHAIGTALIAYFLIDEDLGGWSLVWYWAVTDFLSHFVIDRIKASPKLLGRWKPDQSEFWIALGLDQLAHYLVYVWLISWVLSPI